MFGADVVGMTAAPEAFLARERRLHYGAVAVSINWAAGLHGEVRFETAAMDSMRGRLLPLLTAALEDPLPPAALAGAGGEVRSAVRHRLTGLTSLEKGGIGGLDRAGPIV